MERKRHNSASDSILFSAGCGPMTLQEKEYLLKKGLLFEDSGGDLYGEPSTLSFHDSDLATFIEEKSENADPSQLPLCQLCCNKSDSRLLNVTFDKDEEEEEQNSGSYLSVSQLVAAKSMESGKSDSKLVGYSEIQSSSLFMNVSSKGGTSFQNLSIDEVCEAVEPSFEIGSQPSQVDCPVHASTPNTMIMCPTPRNVLNIPPMMITPNTRVRNWVNSTEPIGLPGRPMEIMASGKDDLSRKIIGRKSLTQGSLQKIQFASPLSSTGGVSAMDSFRTCLESPQSLQAECISPVASKISRRNTSRVSSKWFSFEESDKDCSIHISNWDKFVLDYPGSQNIVERPVRRSQKSFGVEMIEKEQQKNEKSLSMASSKKSFAFDLIEEENSNETIHDRSNYGEVVNANDSGVGIIPATQCCEEQNEISSDEERFLFGTKIDNNAQDLNNEEDLIPATQDEKDDQGLSFEDDFIPATQDGKDDQDLSSDDDFIPATQYDKNESNLSYEDDFIPATQNSYKCEMSYTSTGELDDTVTQMERLLALAEEAEAEEIRLANENNSSFPPHLSSSYVESFLGEIEEDKIVQLDSSFRSMEIETNVMDNEENDGDEQELFLATQQVVKEAKKRIRSSGKFVVKSSPASNSPCRKSLRVFSPVVKIRENLTNSEPLPAFNDVFKTSGIEEFPPFPLNLPSSYVENLLCVEGEKFDSYEKMEMDQMNNQSGDMNLMHEIIISPVGTKNFTKKIINLNKIGFSETLSPNPSEKVSSLKKDVGVFKTPSKIIRVPMAPPLHNRVAEIQGKLKSPMIIKGSGSGVRRIPSLPHRNSPMPKLPRLGPSPTMTSTPFRSLMLPVQEISSPGSIIGRSISPIPKLLTKLIPDISTTAKEKFNRGLNQLSTAGNGKVVVKTSKEGLTTVTMTTPLSPATCPSPLHFVNSPVAAYVYSTPNAHKVKKAAAIVAAKGSQSLVTKIPGGRKSGIPIRSKSFKFQSSPPPISKVEEFQRQSSIGTVRPITGRNSVWADLDGKFKIPESPEPEKLERDDEIEKKQMEKKKFGSVGYVGHKVKQDVMDGHRNVHMKGLDPTVGSNSYPPLIAFASTTNDENHLLQRHTGRLSERGNTSIVKKEQVIKTCIPSRIAMLATSNK